MPPALLPSLFRLKLPMRDCTDSALPAIAAPVCLCVRYANSVCASVCVFVRCLPLAAAAAALLRRTTTTREGAGETLFLDLMNLLSSRFNDAETILVY